MELPICFQGNNLLSPQSSSSVLARLRQRWNTNVTKIIQTENDPSDNKDFNVTPPKFLVVRHRRDGPKSLDIPCLDSLGLDTQHGSLSDIRLHSILKDPKQSNSIRSRDNLKSLPPSLKILEEPSKKSNGGSQADFRDSIGQKREFISRPPSSSKPNSRNAQRPLENVEIHSQSKRMKKVTFAAEVRDNEGQEKTVRRRHIRMPEKAVKLFETEDKVVKIEESDANNFACNLKLAFEPYLRPIPQEQDLKIPSIPKSLKLFTDQSHNLPFELPPIRPENEVNKVSIYKNKNSLFALSPQERGALSFREKSNIHFLSPKCVVTEPEVVRKDINGLSDPKRPFFSIFKKHGSLNSLWSKPNDLGQ